MPATKPRILWGSPESRARGLLSDEVVMFSHGSYSDYMVSRVVVTTRAISADEIETIAQSTKLADNGCPDKPEYQHLWEGDLIEAMLAAGLFKVFKTCELHTEGKFAYEGGPNLTLNLTEHETV